MSQDPPTSPDDPPTDAEEFNERLARLLASARAGGVAVEGAWVCRYPECDRRDHEVMVIGLEDEGR